MLPLQYTQQQLIIGVSALLVAFFVVLYKKRHSIVGKKNDDIKDAKTIIENKQTVNETTTEQEYANN